MPILFDQHIDQSKVLVWEIDQPSQTLEQSLNLSYTEHKRLNERYPNPSSKRHWLASRYALKAFWDIDFRQLIRTDTGRLYWENSQNYLSLSHSGDCVALAQAPQQIGIDIQIQTPKLTRIASKFITADDLAAFRLMPNYQAILHLHWATKEALFKAYIKGKVDFIKHLSLHQVDYQKLDEGTCLGKLHKPNEKLDYQIFYKQLAQYWLVLATSKKP